MLSDRAQRPNAIEGREKLVPYELDARPADSKIVEPASWVEEIQANIGQDCAVNPFILDFLLTKAPQNTNVQRSTVWKSLRKCKDNEAVKHIFTIDYLMKNKAELYGSLTSTTLEDGSNPGTDVDHDNDGTNDYIVEFLHLHGNKNFRENLKEWSKSKVYLNAMKWKMYNDLFNTMSLQKYQYWKRKAADLKLHKADAVLARCAPHVAARGGVWMVKWLNHISTVRMKQSRHLEALEMLYALAEHASLDPRAVEQRFERRIIC